MINNPDDLKKVNAKAIHQEKVIVCTRADSFTDNPPKKMEKALVTDAQIVSTDYPPRTDNEEGDYIFSFENFKTISKIK